MHDPRNPEILAWLETLPLTERLATLHAMSFAFPVLKNDRGWKARIDAVRAKLKPTAEDLARILIEAVRISRRLKIQLAPAEAEG
jgi:hypothetical protein